MKESDIAPLMKAVGGVLKEHLGAIKDALDAIRNRLGTTDALVDDLERRLAALEAKERQR